MALIKSISGIRGTIGGLPGDTLSPLDIVKFTSAYGTWLKRQQHSNKKVVIGRDGRISGAMVQGLVVNTLIALRDRCNRPRIEHYSNSRNGRGL